MNATASPHFSHAPSSDRGDNLVGRLQTSGIFRDYQQAFQTATGLPLVLRAPGAFQAPMAGARNLNPFCALMASRSKTCAACLDQPQRAEAAGDAEAAAALRRRVGIVEQGVALVK